MNNIDIDNYLLSVIEIINKNFNEDKYPEYYKPYKVLDSVVFFWNCGAIVLYHKGFYTIDEDDGQFFLPQHKGIQLSNGWMDEFIQCLTTANTYLKMVGRPIIGPYGTIYGFELNNFTSSYELT